MRRSGEGRYPVSRGMETMTGRVRDRVDAHHQDRVRQGLAPVRPGVDPQQQEADARWCHPSGSAATFRGLGSATRPPLRTAPGSRRRPGPACCPAWRRHAGPGVHPDGGDDQHVDYRDLPRPAASAHRAALPRSGPGCPWRVTTPPRRRGRGRQSRPAGSRTERHASSAASSTRSAVRNCELNTAFRRVVQPERGCEEPGDDEEQDRRSEQDRQDRLSRIRLAEAGKEEGQRGGEGRESRSGSLQHGSCAQDWEGGRSIPPQEVVRRSARNGGTVGLVPLRHPATGP